jgi:hypothetical protein
MHDMDPCRGRSFVLVGPVQERVEEKSEAELVGLVAVGASDDMGEAGLALVVDGGDVVDERPGGLDKLSRGRPPRRLECPSTVGNRAHIVTATVLTGPRATAPVSLVLAPPLRTPSPRSAPSN